MKHLRLFGSRVCVRRLGKRRAKLDRHDFLGLFIGYTVTNKNIRYIDVDFGVDKISHDTVFDEAWYLQPVRPPAAQLLYDLGLTEDTVPAPQRPLEPCLRVPYPLARIGTGL